MTQRPELIRVWGTSSEMEDPTGIYEEGWVTKVKPKHQTSNYLQNAEDENTLSNMQDGVPYWRSDVSYVVNALVKYEDKLYTANVENLNVVPATGVTWGLSLLNYGLKELSDLIRSIDRTNLNHALDSKNPHKTTATQVGAYSKVEFNSALSLSSTGLSQHIQNVGNPHAVSYTQLGILPKEGGTMTWMDFKQKTFTLSGVETLIAESNEALYLNALAGVSMGLKGQIPSFIDGGVWQNLFHTGNILIERNALEPMYTVPPPDMQAELTSTLDTKFCRGGAQTTGDVTFTLSGVSSSEAITFDLASDFIGSNQTITCQLTEGATFTLGNIVFSTQVDSNLLITDGATEIYTGSNDGHFVFVKTDTHGMVYKDGIQVANIAETEPTLPQCNLASGGRAKSIQVWASALTPEQIKMI